MRIVGVVLSLLGGFLLTLALLAWLFLPSRLMVTPLDVHNTTHLSGQATLGEDSFPVKATSITVTDSEASDDDVVVWANSACLVRDEGDVPDCVSTDDSEERLISASVDNFASDRVTGLAVNDPDYLPADAAPHEGLVNKWPFEAEQKTYPYWDSTAGEAIDAEFDGEDTIDDLKVYRYTTDVSDVPIELAEGLEGTYSDTRTIYVEPITGAIVNQVEHQERVTDKGDNFLTLDLAFTDEQVKTSVSDSKDDVAQLKLITKTVPIVAALVGLPLLVLGTVLILLRGRNEREEQDERVPEPVG